MKHGGKWNDEWNDKIEELGLKSSAKIQFGDPFRGVLNSGSTSKGTDAVEQRAPRSDRFGSTEEEWEICLDMVDKRNQNWTYGKIANYLNMSGVRTKIGNKWNYFTARFVTLRTVRLLRKGRPDTF
jgi:hypothetical protein|tara:strand:- start:90 stop:467 length:378 start_codon:yes stop_codon:yes gene_type:complete